MRVPISGFPDFRDSLIFGLPFSGFPEYFAKYFGLPISGFPKNFGLPISGFEIRFLKLLVPFIAKKHWNILTDNFYSIFNLWVSSQYGPFLANIDRSLIVVFVQYGPFLSNIDRSLKPPLPLYLAAANWNHRCRCTLPQPIENTVATTHVGFKNPQIKNWKKMSQVYDQSLS